MRVAILGSGAGSTTHSVLVHEASQPPGACPYHVCRVISSKPEAGILQVGAAFGIETVVVPYEPPSTFGARLIAELERAQVEILVLAGFLRLLPETVIHALDGRVINTHPALLPKHGGAGMYGLNVHRAVLEAGEKETGVSVHWVTEHFDEGAVIAQERVPVLPSDTPEALQNRVKQVEGGFLATMIERIARDRETVPGQKNFHG